VPGWDEARLAFLTFMDQHGVVAGFVVVLIEEAGVPVPVPGDVLMMGLGVHSRKGLVPLWLVLVVLEIATLLGATVLYFMANRGGRGLIYRYGRYMHLTPQRLDRAEEWLKRHGPKAIVGGRLTPGLRMATVIACGVFGIPFSRFLPALAVGALLYIALYTLLGFFVGPAVLDVIEGVHVPIGVLGSLVPLVILCIWVYRARRGLHLAMRSDASLADRRHRWRDGLVAGVLATIISTLLMNVLVTVGSDLALLAPGDLVERARARFAVLAMIRVIGPVLLLAAVPAFVTVGAVWGAIYAQTVEPYLRWPDWVSGLCFAMLPLCAALVIVLPVLDGAAPDLGQLGPLAAASEAVRHAAFGLALGLIYPLRLARLPEWRRRRAVIDPHRVHPAEAGSA
jgi:membrane protein DedA with SNARE-associated domain